jgi:hypothetical protein
MSACGYSRELLSAWIDGEAGGRAAEIERHVRACQSCSDAVREARESSEILRELVDAGVGEIEPLVALRAIRERIALHEGRSLVRRLTDGWADLWAYHRGAVAGVMVAAGLGALSAPAVVLWASRAVHEGGASASLASVVIESMEWEGDAQAVVYTSASSSTTLIWVANDGDHEPR